jgi:hypothetical protein
VGCGIYEKRPAECRGFQCGYLLEPELDEQWKPSTSRLVVASAGPNCCYVYVDPQRPNAWRREPYYSRIKHWTKQALEAGGQIAVFVGTRVWMALPQGDVDLGIYGPDDMIVVDKTVTARGVTYSGRMVNKDDPRARGSPMSPFSMTPLNSDWQSVRATFRRP